MKQHIGLWTAASAADDGDIWPEAPPMAVGLDDRRMQLRAWRHWEQLRGGDECPPIAALALEKLPDFADSAALLALRANGAEPVVTHLGARLAQDCARAAPGHTPIRRAGQVPANSLLGTALSRIETLAPLRTPIGFEDEIIDDSGTRIVCRGMLLPFARSPNGNKGAITHILAIIGGRAVADGALHDALHAEMAALGLWDRPPATTPAPEDDGPTLPPGALPRD